MEKSVDLLIIGAGPFGLAMAAYAQHLGIDHAIVGKPMEFWKAHMPEGMYLRSSTVPHLDPMNRHTIEAFLEAQGLTHADVEPPSLRFYLNYAQWFQEQKRLQALPALIRRLCHGDGDEDRFRATLDDGRIIRARHVVIAVGFKPFKHLPPKLVERLPLGRFSHTCDRVNFQGLAGKRCLIIGGRQSAFEWAALLHEAGAAAVHVAYRHASPVFQASDLSWIGPLMEAIADDPGWFRRLLEDTVGRRAVALIAAEIGGANAMEPMLTAAQAGIPVVDGDGMGRAFPEVQMMTYLIYGHPATPAAIADEKGNRVVFRDAVDMFWLERFARSIAVDMGGTAGLATAPMRVDFLKRYAIPGTVSQAVALGRTIQKARAGRANVVDAICREEGGIRLFAGKITGVERELRGGFAVGGVDLEGLSAHAGETGRITIQNENLVFWRDGRMEACVPDLIVNVELDTGEPITTEMLRYGQRITTLALPAHELLKTPRALAVVGPAAFGYSKLTYRPLPARHR